MNKLTILLLAIFATFSACNKGDRTNPAVISPGNDPNFTIVSNSDAGFINCNRKVVVFGVDIYAVSTVEDSKLLHAANLLAQYLDNDENDIIDNQLVLDKMIENNAFLFLWKTESDFPNNPPANRIGQDLGNDETIPTWHTNGHSGRFDAAIEEVWHIVTHAGHESAYPNVFGTDVGTEMSNAMDLARGGQFISIPNPYPTNAWYSYDDQTCDYSCQAGEYIYWIMSSMLGAQKNRLSEIGNEWKLNTNALVQSTDVAAYALLSDTQYKFPTVLPDGTYKH
jgi:hypothetical protein